MTERSQPAGRGSGPGVSLPIGEVASLDLARRITRATTTRGTCYSEKFERLSLANRVRVEAMEAQLFAAGPRAGSCSPGALPLPDSQFHCADGSIWFHYSATSRAFWLGCFELHDRGGRRGNGPASTRGEGIAGHSRCGWSDGIAARLSQLFATPNNDRYDMDLVGWLVEGERRQTVHVVIDGLELLLSRPRPEGKLLIDIATACRGLSSQDGFAVLPAWSLLANVADVQEQLHNQYARSIFAGEAFCRIGEAICAFEPSQREAVSQSKKRRMQLEWMPAIKSPTLLWESAAILATIRDAASHCDLVRSCQGYITAPLMDENMLADLRRLALIRSEMNFRLAMSVYQQIGTEPHAENEVLHRYALLSDFVRLSAPYFGCEDVFPNYEAALDALDGCALKSRRTVCAVMGELEEFAYSTAMISHQLTYTGEKVSVLDKDMMHDRLLGIATLLLETSNNGE